MSWIGLYANMCEHGPLTNGHQHSRFTRPTVPTIPSTASAPCRSKIPRPSTAAIVRRHTATSLIANLRRAKRPCSAAAPDGFDKLANRSIDSAWAMFGEARVLLRQQKHQDAWAALLEAKYLIDGVHIGCDRRQEALLQLGHELSALTQSWLLREEQFLHPHAVRFAAMDSPAKVMPPAAPARSPSRDAGDISVSGQGTGNVSQCHPTGVDTRCAHGAHSAHVGNFVATPYTAQHQDACAVVSKFSDGFHRPRNHTPPLPPSPSLVSPSATTTPNTTTTTTPTTTVATVTRETEQSVICSSFASSPPPSPPPPLVDPNRVADIGEPRAVPLYAFEVVRPSVSMAKPERVGPNLTGTIPRRTSSVHISRSLSPSTGSLNGSLPGGRRPLFYTSLYNAISRHESHNDDGGDSSAKNSTALDPPPQEQQQQQQQQQQNIFNKDTEVFPEMSQEEPKAGVCHAFDPVSPPTSVSPSLSDESFTSPISSLMSLDCFRHVVGYQEARELHQRMVRRLLEERAAEERRGSPAATSRAGDLLGRLEEAYHEWLVDHLGINGRPVSPCNIPSTAALTPVESFPVDPTPMSSSGWNSADSTPARMPKSVCAAAGAPNSNAVAVNRLDSALAFSRTQKRTPKASGVVKRSLELSEAPKDITVDPAALKLNKHTRGERMTKEIKETKKESNKRKKNDGNEDDDDDDDDVLGQWGCRSQQMGSEGSEVKEELRPHTGRTLVFLRC